MVPVDKTHLCVVSLYKGKSKKCECTSCKVISLLIVEGKVYGRILIKRVRDGTEGVICGHQCGFIKGWSCLDNMFTVKHRHVKSFWQRKRSVLGFCGQKHMTG